MRSSRAFTLMEVLVVISIIALLMAILVPGLALAKRTANQMKSKTQLKSIQNNFVVYSDKNNDWYPGVTNTGANGYYDYVVNTNDSDLDIPVTPGAAPYGPGAVTAFWLLMREAFLLPEDVVSPVDDETLQFDPVTIDGDGLYDVDDVDGDPVDTWGFGNYSYATLEISVSSGVRRRLWRNNGNAQLPIAGDRAIKNDADDSGSGAIRSIHTNPDEDITRWNGFIVWNDGHVSQGNEQADTPTRLSDANPINDDYLFGAPGNTLLQHNNVDANAY